MDIASGATPLFRFAGFEFHANTGELRHQGRNHPLPEQARRVLLALLKANGEVVSREELRTTLWPDRSFGDFEGGLNTAICKLRQVLEDDGAEPHIIGTLPRRGYRMLVPVEKTAGGGKRENPLDGGQGPGAKVSPGSARRDGLPDSDLAWVGVGPAEIRQESGAPLPRAENTASGANPATWVWSSRKTRTRWMIGGALLLVLGASVSWVLAQHEPRLRARLVLTKAARPIQILRGRILRNPLGMEFVRIPAGSFEMGRDITTVGWGGDRFEDKPVHLVVLTRPFLMQTTEVTVEQFKAFVEATNYRTEGEMGAGIRISEGLRPASASQANLPETMVRRLDASWRNPYFEQQPSCPVVGVSWNDTQAFLAWLNEKDPGKGYRLPTEAEWECACRAGLTGDALHGPLDDIAWHSRNSGFRTRPAASRLPNGFGLYDMLGNAREWCQDWYAPGYPAGPVMDPKGPSWGTLKVARGGAWHSIGA